MTLRRRIRALTATTCLVLISELSVGGSALAQAASSCAFDADTGVVSIDVNSHTTVLVAPGGNHEILVDSSSGPVDLCGGATVNNADRIDVQLGEYALFIHRAATFAPGRTLEATGASEIEFHITQASDGSVFLMGTENEDTFTTAAISHANAPVDAVNINDDDDHDVLVDPTGLSSLSVSGGRDADRIDLSGGDDAPATSVVGAAGGGGPDVIAFRGSEADSSVFGGRGSDTLDLRRVAEGDQIIVDLRSGEGTIPSVTDLARFSVSDVERVIGHAGEGYLFGMSGRDVLEGRGSWDVIEGRGGNDVLDGGVGSDVLNGGAGSDVCIGTRRDDFRNCERVRLR